jgi:serine/threonine protein kinase/tetratricopeptide (TPR) repeat protein
MTTASTTTLVAGLAAEMSARWRDGERPCVEDFLERAAGPRRRDVILELIYEEFCLRLRHGPAATVAEYAERFPDYRQELEILLGCHQLLEPAPTAATTPPGAGETLGPFRLLAELGRGSLGHVFLARQSALGDRPVVLKITPRAHGPGREHLALARLQHTHIVPIYAAHDHAERDVRILCMPYFGSATLARVLEILQPRPLSRRRGRDMVDAIDHLQAAAPVALAPRGPAREVLAQSTYVQAVCRLGICLADALHYAHERGLVHLDVKPSNILLALDGQPMLLDFHLAQAPLAASQPAPAWLGGTRAYMPPEQQAALAAASRGQPLPEPVDHRTDLFALGVLLYQALTDRLPAAPPVAAHKLNPEVSRGLSDILGRCLAPRAEHRYADGAALAADLHRHLSDRPLVGVRNRSVLERWRKWRRRRPHGLVLARMFVAVLAAAVAVGFMLWDRWNGQLGQARIALADGTEQLKRGRPAEAADTFGRGLALVESQPLGTDLRAKLRARLDDALAARCEQAQAAIVSEFHRLADALRFTQGSDRQLTPAAAALAERCAALWEKRALLLDQAGPDVRRDLLDVVLLWTDLRVRLAAPADEMHARREALRRLGEAEHLLGGSHVLYRQVELLERALGRPEQADAAARRAADCPPQTAWEHCMLGRHWLLSAASAHGAQRTAALDRASTALEQAVTLEPQGLWPNYYLGQCAYRAGRYEQAIRALNICIGAAPAGPAAAELFACRALAHAALGEAEPALRDHAHARKLDPAAAGPLAAVHYNLAVAAATRGDYAAARRHLELALGDDPGHAAARELFKQLAP